MLLTYKAILRGDRIEWIGQSPQTNGGAPVHVTILNERATTDDRARGQRMADALQSLTDSGGISTISDPVAWQCEIRKDRQLPGRDE